MLKEANILKELQNKKPTKYQLQIQSNLLLPFISQIKHLHIVQISNKTPTGSARNKFLKVWLFAIENLCEHLLYKL